MTELTCNATNCAYNEQQKCSRGDIFVGTDSRQDDTCCESFAEKKTDRFTSSLHHPSAMIGIDCEATTCFYNHDYKCSAEHVDIRGCGAEKCEGTSCGTYRER